MISNMCIYQNIHIRTKLQKVELIDINYKSTTILVKTISTTWLVSEYHEFFHYHETNRIVYFVTNKQTYLTVGNGHHFSGEA